MKNLHLKWSFNNKKVSKLGAVSFSIPAFRSADGFHTCPKAGGCASLCYARQGRYVIPSVAGTREFNLAKVRGDLSIFLRETTEDLQRIKNPIVRVHDSGDFFSQEYMDVWFTLARLFPTKQFYAYTKSLHLNWRAAPKNFQIIQSVGGLLDDRIDTTRSHSRIFATVKDRKAAGYVDGNRNDQPAIDGVRKIGLVYHGTRNLKEGQIAWLRQVS